MSEKKIKLLIGVCSGRGWSSRFGQSLAMLTLHLGLGRLRGADGEDRLDKCGLRVHHNAYLVTSRNDHIVEALKQDYTHFLSLDDDMMFPVEVVEQMLAHDKPVVTVNYRKKYAERLEFVCTSPDGSATSSFNKTGLERVVSMGMGLALFKLDAIRHVPGPYFGVVWDEATGAPIIEDKFFCLLLNAHGVDIWCDHDLSQKVAHMGEYEFKIPTPRPLDLVSNFVEQRHDEQIQAARGR